MIITEKERKHLLDQIIGIQYNLGVLTYSIDATKDAESIAAILQYLSVLTSDITHSKILQETDVEKELCF